VHLDVHVALAYEGRAVLTQAFDVCEGGMGVTMPVPLPAGSVVSVSFSLPGSPELINLAALVLHPENGECGLAFPKIDAMQRRLLRRYINTRRFLHGDLRAPSDNPDVGKRMTERLGKVRRLTLLI
jgi:hypothetical protein